MANVADLVAVLRANTTDFNAKMAAAEGQLSSVGKSASGMSKVGGLAFAAMGAAAIGFGAMAFNAASDMNESMSKVNVVFKENAAAVRAWSSDAAQSMGMSRQAALEAAGTFGNFLISMGETVPHAQKMSQSLVQLAADLASFNNTSPEDALLALRSGLSGEVEPLRKYGVALSAARVEQEAMNSGLNKSYNELTAAEKATLSYQIILKDTKLAQGDFARTSSGAANQQRILKAELQDLAANLGKVLYPAITQVIHGLVESIKFFEEHKAAAIALAVIVGGPLVHAMLSFMAVKVGAFIETVVTSFWTMVGAAGAAVESLATFAVAALPFIAVAAGIAAAVVAIGYPMHLIFGNGGQMDEMLSSFKKGQDEGKRYADILIAGANDTKSPIETLRGSLENLRYEQATLTQAAHAGSVEFKSGVESYASNATAIKQVKKEIADLKQKQAEANAEAHAMADNYGVKVPGALKFTSDQVKSLKDDVAQFASSIEGSMNQATDPFAHFGTQAAVSQGDMEAFFVGSQLKAQTWAGDIQTLIGEGVDKGIVQNMAKAGPDSLPAMEAFVQMVKDKGVDWVNSVYQSGQAATKSVEDAYGSMALIAAIKSAEMAMVTKAAMADMKEGGTRHLTALAASSNQQLGDMAVNAIAYIQSIQPPIDALHGKRIDLDIFANDYASSTIATINSDLQNLGIYGPTFAGLDMIPHAAGGVFSSPHVGLVAEAGPEAIVPLNNPSRAAQVMAQAGLIGGGGGGTVNITVNAGMGADGQAIAQTIANELTQLQRRGGSVPWN